MAILCRRPGGESEKSMEQVITNSPAETEAVGERLGNRLLPGDVIAFEGGLGMGKTVFVRGVARGLGSDAEVTSPTFALINEYRGGRLNLCHMDAYRLSGPGDLPTTGFYDYLDAGWICAVEWGERV
ncbi:MAG: tRNA (adenosine(37)-N6)-threonylcarbamoyltransferase complex ATPase subunit type 1 TsaE, partial [Oscillospiraceae bacterium]